MCGCHTHSKAKDIKVGLPTVVYSLVVSWALESDHLQNSCMPYHVVVRARSGNYQSYISIADELANMPGGCQGKAKVIGPDCLDTGWLSQ